MACHLLNVIRNLDSSLIILSLNLTLMNHQCHHLWLLNVSLFDSPSLYPISAPSGHNYTMPSKIMHYTFWSCVVVMASPTKTMPLWSLSTCRQHMSTYIKLIVFVHLLFMLCLLLRYQVLLLLSIFYSSIHSITWYLLYVSEKCVKKYT